MPLDLNLHKIPMGDRLAARREIVLVELPPPEKLSTAVQNCEQLRMEAEHRVAELLKTNLCED